MTAVFECTRCGECCRNLSDDRVVLLFPGELEAIAECFSIDPKLMTDLTEPVAQFADIGIDARKLRHNDGVCVFLGNDNLCVIHSIKPYQCRMGPNRFLFDWMSDYACMSGIEPPQDVNLDTEIDLFRLFLKP